MADDEPKRFTKTAIAFQGGGALGAYSLGVLRYLYESEPGFRPSYVSGVSIGAFTAAILASAPEQPLHRLEQFWAELSIADLPFVPRWLEGNLSAFGNPAFYRPRMDYFDFANWTSYYDLSPIRATLERYVDLGRIARGEVKLAVTATDIASGEVVSFSNTDASKPLTLEHVIASGSLPPGFPPTVIENRAYWDGGLFSNTPLSALFDLVTREDAEQTRVIVVDLFPKRGKVPKTMLDVADRMVELQFANKTEADVAMARKINALVLAVKTLAGGDAESVFANPALAEVAKYRVFDNIIAITNDHPEPVSSSSDFSRAAVERRIAAGYDDARRTLAKTPPGAAETARALANLR